MQLIKLQLRREMLTKEGSLVTQINEVSPSVC